MNARNDCLYQVSDDCSSQMIYGGGFMDDHQMYPIYPAAYVPPALKPSCDSYVGPPNLPGDDDSFSKVPIRGNGLLAKLNLPCQSYANWDYNQCYNYYVNGCYNTCQFVKMVDMEDFM